MGLDSLMAIELKTRIKTASGVDLPMVQFIESLTIAGLAGLLEERIAAARDGVRREVSPIGSQAVPDPAAPAGSPTDFVEGAL